VAAHAEAIVVDVEFEERYWYPSDGAILWLSGFGVVDPATGRYLARDDPALTERGLRIANVAGAERHHADVLTSDAAAPGAPLTLRRDPGNAHDPSAIAVDLAATGEQLGWVPRELAAELAPRLDAGTAWSAVVLRDRRRSPRDPRTGATMLLARAPAIELRPR
jgi:hypothetical protein